MSSLPSALGGHGEETSVHEPGSRTSPDTASAAALILALEP